MTVYTNQSGKALHCGKCDVTVPTNHGWVCHHGYCGLPAAIAASKEEGEAMTTDRSRADAEYEATLHNILHQAEVSAHAEALFGNARPTGDPRELERYVSQLEDALRWYGEFSEGAGDGGRLARLVLPWLET